MLLDVLLMLPNNYSNQLMEGRWLAAAPGIVRRAEEFLEANAAQPITISDVVAVCGCSRRALFGAFRKYRGYTPMQFLTESRLRCAHLALRTPTSGDTVRRIAARSGFSNLGRFAALYRERYGERPSLTLRRSVDG
jgi:transcriptional regulator GlxA family with amidase domain